MRHSKHTVGTLQGPANHLPTHSKAREQIDVTSPDSDAHWQPEAASHEHRCHPVWKRVVRVNQVERELVVQSTDLREGLEEQQHAVRKSRKPRARSESGVMNLQ
jgi:uncharacterized membrane protein